MRFDGRRDIFGKVRVDSRGRVLGEQSYAFRDSASNWFGWTKNGNGTLVPFNDNFRARLHPCQQSCDVSCRCLRFGDVERTLCHRNK
jgi:hypothetical protein